MIRYPGHRTLFPEAPCASSDCAAEGAIPSALRAPLYTPTPAGTDYAGLKADRDADERSRERAGRCPCCLAERSADVSAVPKLDGNTCDACTLNDCGCKYARPSLHPLLALILGFVAVFDAGCGWALVDVLIH